MIKLIQEKLAVYGAVNQLEEEHAVKEILQEIALYGLWRAGFFECAAFQGGTSLRILYGMSRFSEELVCKTQCSTEYFTLAGGPVSMGTVAGREQGD